MKVNLDPSSSDRRRQLCRRVAVAALVFCALPSSGQSCPPAVDPPRQGISLEEVGVPAGWMGQDTTNLKKAIGLKGISGKECGDDQGKCLEVTYDPSWGWAGVYWWPTACEQEKDPWAAVQSGSCAIDLQKVAGKTKIVRLTFCARGTTGKEVVTFGIGGDSIPPCRTAQRAELTTSWQSYVIDLRKTDLKKVGGLFFWTASGLDNPKGFKVYLRDVVFEKAPEK